MFNRVLTGRDLILPLNDSLMLLAFNNLGLVTSLYGKRISTGSGSPPRATFALLSKFYATLFLFS